MLRRLAMTSDNGAWGITDSRTSRLSGRWLLLSLLVVWGPQQVRAQVEDLPTVTLLFNSSTATVVEGSVLNVQLVAQGTYNKSFDVSLTFTDGTAVQPLDYTLPFGSPPTVRFEAGAVSSSVLPVVAMPNNACDPVRRSFRVTFELPDVECLRLRFGRPRRLSVTIVDDDSVKVAFQAPYLMVEEDAGFVKVQLQAEGLYSRPFQVSFACVPVVPTEAKGGADFEGGVYTVTFDSTGAQESVSSIASIEIYDDSICEPKEAFICVILRPHVGCIVVGDPKTISVQILDDDPSSISFMTDSITLSEKNGNNVATLRLAASHEFQNEQIVQVTAIDDLLDSSDCDAISCLEPNSQNETDGSCKCSLGCSGVNCTDVCVNNKCGTEENCKANSFSTLGYECIPNSCSSLNCTGNTTCAKNGTSGYACLENFCLSDSFCHRGNGKCDFSPQTGNSTCECNLGYDFCYGCKLVLSCSTNTTDPMLLCQNGALCVYDPWGFKACNCTGGFTGTRCQDHTCDVDSPCGRRGECSPSNSTPFYSCDCFQGYTGPTCDQSDPCSLSPCLNNGTCSDAGSDGFECTCTPGWDPETNCSLRINRCERNPCGNGGTCTDGESKCCAKTRGARDYNLSSAFNTSSRTVMVRFPRNSKFSDPFRVHIVDDDEEENWEKFYLNLTIPAKAAECGAFLGENRTLETLVKDDDGVRVGFEMASISKTGTEGTTVILNIYRHGRMRRRTKIFIATEHITTARNDFKAKKEFVTFKKRGNQSEVVKFKIRLTKDRKVEGKESFVVRLTRANRPNVGFDRRCALVTIMDPPTTTLLPTTDA